MDAARADRLSSYGYSRETTPALDALAAEGVILLNHYAQATTTRASLPSLLTSRHFVPPLFPASDRIPFSSPSDLFRRADDASISLPRAMAGSGLHTAMISAHTWLGEETALATEFDEAHDLSSRLEFDPSDGYPDAEAVMDYTLDWLSRHRNEEFFLYLHLMDTHFPHRPGPEALAFLGETSGELRPPDRFTEAGGVRNTDAPLEDRERAYLDALYDGSLRHTDSQLQRLFQAMDTESGRRLVAVTSDHGEALMEQPGRFGHGIAPYETVARIPLILWAPGLLEPGRIEALTSGIDLAPTILGLLGLAPPEGRTFDGRDLSPLLAGEGAGRAGEVVIHRAVRADQWKCIFHAEDGHLLAETAPRVEDLQGELYDLSTDPGETVNLWHSRPDSVSEMLNRYRGELLAPWNRYLASARHAPPPAPFAIAVRHLTLEPERDCTREISRLEEFFGSGQEWMRFCDPKGDYLVGEEGAGAIELHVPVPSGRYRLSLGLRGQATLAAHGADGPARLDGGEFDPWDWFPWTMEPVPAGEVEVTDSLFHALLEPFPGGAPLAVGYVGFSPLDGRAGPSPGEARRLERLRSLGYVH